MKYSYMHYINKILLAIFCFWGLSVNAQIKIVVPTAADTVLCTPAPVTLQAVNVGRNPHPVTFGFSNDDYYSNTTIPIGFSFNFYGNTYTNCVISSNGYISFNASDAGNSSAYYLQGQPGVPGNTNCKNSILGCYSDIYLLATTGGGGTIDYGTIGTAPNREFIVTFCNVQMYSCTQQHIIMQMILYEGSNVADVYIKQKQVCSGWNGGLAVQGVQNSTGTVGTAVTGRNNTVWTATNDGKRFTPDATFSSYSVSSVPYFHIVDTNSNLYWYKGFPISGPPLAIGDTFTVFPPIDSPTVYTVMAVDCGDTAYSTVTVIESQTPVISAVTSINPTHCGSCNGTITLHGISPGLSDTLNYYENNVAQPTIVTTAGADSTITLSNLCSGEFENFTIKVGYCISAPVGPVTLVDPPIDINVSVTQPTVCGAANGKITISNIDTGVLDTVTYRYNGIVQPQIVMMASPNGTITISSLDTGTYDSIFVKAFTCISSPQNAVVLYNPPFNIDSFSAANPTTCGVNDGFIYLYGATPNQVNTVTYSLNGVPQPTINTSTNSSGIILLSGLTAGTYSDILVTLNYCSSVVPGPITLTTQPPVASFKDTIHYACTGDTVLFTGLATPAGDTFFRYYWHFGDGGYDSTNNPNPVHVYSAQGTYFPTVIYSNGYCADSITQPVALIHPLVAAYTVDRDTICLDQSITFTNTSTTTNGPYNVAPTFLWSFGDTSANSTDINVTHPYHQPGDFNTRLLVTDFVPCMDSTSKEVYVGTFSVDIEPHDTSFCISAPYMINTSVTSPTADLFSSYSYQWSPAVGLDNPNAQNPMFFDTGDHHYVVAVTGNPVGCTYYDSVTLHAHPPITLVNVTPDTMIAYGSSLQLNASGAYYYFWTPDNATLSNPNIANPVATPLDTVTYEVHGMSYYGCPDSAFVRVGIDFSMNEFIPSAFSPNGDGINDQLHVLNLKYQKLLDFRVFNRWGQVVFSTNNPQQGWDGTFNGVAQDIGDYNYMVIIARPDGTEKQYKGTVTLIR